MSKETNKQILNDKLDYVRLAGEICGIVVKVLFTVAFVSGFYSILLRFFASHFCRALLSFVFNQQSAFSTPTDKLLGIPSNLLNMSKFVLLDKSIK